MAVKFSDFTQKTEVSTTGVANVTEIVGYESTGELNVRITPLALDTTYAYATTNGASPALTLTGTKPGLTITDQIVTLSGAGSVLLAGTGTNAISITGTTYVLSTTTVALGQTNVPVNFTGSSGGDAHTDTLNLKGSGTVQISSDAGTGLITIDGGAVGDVTSVNQVTGATSTGQALTVAGTGAGPFTGDVTVAANIYGGTTNPGIVPGTGAAGQYLDGGLGVGWQALPAGYSNWLLAGGLGTPQTISDTNTATFSSANAAITTTASATGILTISSVAYAGQGNIGHVPSGGVSGQYLDGDIGAWTTLPPGYTRWDLTGDTGTTEQIGDLSTVDIAGGTDINTVASATNTLTVNHDTISRTDTTSANTPAPLGTVDLVKSITTSAQGHVTAIDVSTVTWPAGGGGFGSINQTTGTGSSLGAIPLGSTPAAAFNCLISISGVTQNYLDAAGTPNWTVSTNTLTFAFNPPVTATNGIQIIVIA